MINDSDLILFMLNNNEKLSIKIKELLSRIKNKKYLILINKIDLSSQLNKKELKVPNDRIIELSITKNIGIENLKAKIKEFFNLNELETKDPTYLNNVRSISILKKCLKRIRDIEEAIKNKTPIDIIEIDIKKIWEDLGMINGSTYDEELLDEMFSRFCLGK